MFYDAIVIGAGIHGLCAAFWLRMAGRRCIAVIERGAPGHVEGSSHGKTRITRSSYHEPQFVRLAETAHREGWPALERELGQSLRIPTKGVFFGPADGPFDAYLEATLAAANCVERLSARAAAAQFPQLRFDAGDAVLLDHSAAVVLAATTMGALREWLAANEVELHWHCPALEVRAERDAVSVATPRGTLHGRGAIVAAGAATPRLLPGFSIPLSVLYQQVGYFDVEADPAALAAGAFPVWARIGRTANDFQYGLPSIDDSGVKIAQHRTQGPAENDLPSPPPVDPDALWGLARARLAAPPRSLRATETCLYTMTPDHGFLVARPGGQSRLVGVAACSGHGFKFGPVIGRAAADLLPVA